MNILLENSRHINYYGNMNDIFNVLDGVCEKYDWYISDIETNCQPPIELRSKELFIEGDALKKLISENDIQFIWAVFSAMKRGVRPFVKESPFADGNPGFWEGSPNPQLNGAEFEIVCWDSSLYLLIGVSESLAKKFIAKYSDAIDLDSHNEKKS
jgi:hypothetical protein